MQVDSDLNLADGWAVKAHTPGGVVPVQAAQQGITRMGGRLQTQRVNGFSAHHHGVDGRADVAEVLQRAFAGFDGLKTDSDRQRQAHFLFFGKRLDFVHQPVDRAGVSGVLSLRSG